MSTYVTIQQYADHRATSKRTVERWVKAGLPSVKQGGQRRIKKEEADFFIDTAGLDKPKRAYRTRLKPSSLEATVSA
jgi:excisionase family DNA binding protein